MKPSSTKIKAFQEKILGHYAAQGRELPWRQTTSRYRILVSEIMLQQTQVSRVVEKYKEWLKAFPTVKRLAEAELKDVLIVWSGLGYNSRGKRLWECAKIIVKEHKSKVPNTVEELMSLPGIGPYTARSVLIFADNEDLATVDTNIRRILIHEFKLSEITPDKELFTLAELVMPKGRSRDWNNALMDYGTAVLTSKSSGIKPKTKQSPFKQSKRYCRGQIIKLLTNGKKLDEKKLQNAYPDCPHDFAEILDGLENEGLIRKKEKEYVI